MVTPQAVLYKVIINRSLTFVNHSGFIYFQYMNKGILLLLVLNLAYQLAKAQTTERFYDYQGYICEPGRARFYARISHSDSGWIQSRYYLPSRNLQSKTGYSDSACTIKQGKFYTFYPNQQLETIGKYTNNLKDSTWLSFYANGVMKDSTRYDEGEVTGTSLQWHNNGYMSDSTVYGPDGIRVSVSWFDNGSISAAGRLSEIGMPHGKWQFFHRNGQLSAEEVYSRGRLISRKYFSTLGVPETDTSVAFKPASFPGGTGKWSEYMQKKLYWPNGYQIVNGNKVEIAIQFTIDEYGNVKDPLITVPFDDAFNNIVMRMIQHSPRWEPAISHNRKVSFIHKQTISFTQIRN